MLRLYKRFVRLLYYHHITTCIIYSQNKMIYIIEELIFILNKIISKKEGNENGNNSNLINCLR